MRARTGVALAFALWLTLGLGSFPALAEGETVELLLDVTEFEKGTGEAVVLSGTVFVRTSAGNGSEPGPLVPHPGAQVRVSFVEPPLTTGYAGTTDDSGMFAITVPGRTTAGTYKLAVIAVSDLFGAASPIANVTWVVVAGQGAPGQPLPGLGALAGIAAAAVTGMAGRRRVKPGKSEPE